PAARPEAPVPAAATGTAAAAGVAVAGRVAKPIRVAVVPRHVARRVGHRRRRVHPGRLLLDRSRAPRWAGGGRGGVLRCVAGGALRSGQERLTLPTIVYCSSCAAAIVLVAVGVLAANIALLLILVVMAGVCSLMETRRRRHN